MVWNVDNLMRQRLAKWERRRRLAQEAETLAQTQQPTIALSRSVGSTGRLIAAEVARQLGIDLYDRKIIEAIAEAAHVRDKVVESVGETTQRRIVAWIDRQVQGGYFGGTDYLHHLSKVVLSIGQHGDAIVLGRGAQFILNPQKTLAVRVVAPRDIRIRRMATRESMGISRARAEVRRIDAERAEYCRRHFHRDVDDLEQYDLVVGTGSLSVASAAALVVEAYRQRFADAADSATHNQGRDHVD